MTYIIKLGDYMTIQNIYTKANLVKNQSSIPEDKRKIYITICDTEIRRQISNENIEEQKKELKELGCFLIEHIKNSYNLLDDNQKEKAENILNTLMSNPNADCFENSYIEANDRIDEIVIQMDSLGRKIENEFIKKYTYLKHSLSPFVSSEFLSIIPQDGAWKSVNEVNAIALKEIEKLKELNIIFDGESILVHTLLDIIKYAQTKGKANKEIPEWATYAEQILENLKHHQK